MTTVTFNGTDLTQQYVVTNVQRPFAKRTIQQEVIPGRDGAVIGNITYDAVEISMDIVLVGQTRAQRSDTMRNLAALLSVREPVQLAFSDDGGKYYLAIPNGGNIIPYIGADYIEGVVFTCPSPAMYDEMSQEEVVESGEPINLVIGGNYPTAPLIRCERAFRDSDTGLWGVQNMTTGEVLQIPIPTDDASNVIVDCANHTATVNGQTAVPTLNSDWFVLDPGTYRFENALGRGAWSIRFTNRWI